MVQPMETEIKTTLNCDKNNLFRQPRDKLSHKKIEGRTDLLRRVKVVPIVHSQKKNRPKGLCKQNLPLGHRTTENRMGRVLTPLVFPTKLYQIHVRQERRMESLCDEIQKIDIQLPKTESPAQNEDTVEKELDS